MSKYDNAGLAMIPSGYKASKVYSVIPNTADGDFDFSRASTATRVNKDGLIEVVASNVPRLDYQLIDGVVQDCPALLLEPSRSNVLPYSSDFSQWSAASGASVVGNKLGVGGSNDAFEFFSDGTSSTRLFYTVSITGESSYSVFAKKNTLDYISLYANDDNNARVWFNLDNGTLGNQESGAIGVIEDYGNGWYRCTLKWTSSNLVDVRIYNSNENDVVGGTSGSVYIQYAQLEAGSYPTSYIPTSGSTVTRVADTCNGAGTSDTFNSSEGVLFVEMAALAREKTLFELISLSDGTTTNRMYLGFASGTNKLIWLYGASVFSGDTTSIETTNNNKIAFKFKDNDFAIWVNGVEIDSQLSGSTFSSNTFNTMGFDSGSGSATTRLYANLKQLMTFNKALTDSELEDLTSWDSFLEMAQGQLYKTY